MRRLVAIALAFLAGAGLLASNAIGQGDEVAGDGDYLIRAYFDSAGFLVDGEDVRIAGAGVGSVEEVDVSREGEVVNADGTDLPGKAVAVLRIDDPGFQDFRADASCLIRPQSLLGEKFVECDPTRPRAAGSEPPAPLEVIPEGEIGEGQVRLPIDNNGKAVDIDLVNNVMREPYVDRFRLILNDLGAGVAARGEDLGEVLERANPALKQTDEVLAILAEQNRGLAQLAADSDQILAPLAREREGLAGFIRNATTAGQAAAERRADISAGFRNFPPALSELQATMVELRGFSEEATPVASNLLEAAPGLTGATRELAPFSRAGTDALTTLGQAAAESGPDLAASAPLIRQLRQLAVTGLPGAKNLNRLFRTLRKTGGIDHLMDLILNTSNVFNGYDEFGHYLRAQIQITNCVEYVTEPRTGCGANWAGGSTTAAFSGPAPDPTRATLEGEGAFGPTLEDLAAAGELPTAEGTDEDGPAGIAPGTAGAGEAGPETDEKADASAEGARDLLQFLIGNER